MTIARKMIQTIILIGVVYGLLQWVGGTDGDGLFGKEWTENTSNAILNFGNAGAEKVQENLPDPESVTIPAIDNIKELSEQGEQ